jgi:hypothetical protein
MPIIIIIIIIIIIMVAIHEMKKWVKVGTLKLRGEEMV